MHYENGKAVPDQADLDFAMEANDILRDLWNRGTLDDLPQIKQRVGKLLEVSGGDYTV